MQIDYEVSFRWIFIRVHAFAFVVGERKVLGTQRLPLSILSVRNMSAFGFEVPRPSSPTDNMMSPCSKSLFGSKKHLNKPTKRSNIAQNFTLEAQVKFQPCPSKNMRLIVGTASTCRRNVFDALMWDYEQMQADIDEKAIRHDDPMEMPVLIAKAKATALIEKYNMTQFEEPAMLMTFDQIVLYKSQVREKPESREEAVEFLSSYSNDAVSTVSAVVVTHVPSGIQRTGIDYATVYWKEIPDEVVQRVVDRGEVMSSAGGFLVEDVELNGLIKGIDRPVDSVMGMPVDLAKRLMLEVLVAAAAAGESEQKQTHE